MPVSQCGIFYVFTSENVNPIQYHGGICKSEDPSRRRIKRQKAETGSSFFDAVQDGPGDSNRGRAAALEPVQLQERRSAPRRFHVGKSSCPPSSPYVSLSILDRGLYQRLLDAAGPFTLARPAAGKLGARLRFELPCVLPRRHPATAGVNLHPRPRRGSTSSTQSGLKTLEQCVRSFGGRFRNPFALATGSGARWGKKKTSGLGNSSAPSHQRCTMVGLGGWDGVLLLTGSNNLS